MSLQLTTSQVKPKARNHLYLLQSVPLSLSPSLFALFLSLITLALVFPLSFSPSPLSLNYSHFLISHYSTIGLFTHYPSPASFLFHFNPPNHQHHHSSSYLIIQLSIFHSLITAININITSATLSLLCSFYNIIILKK